MASKSTKKHGLMASKSTKKHGLMASKSTKKHGVVGERQVPYSTSVFRRMFFKQTPLW
jgi:hypothetical protein